MALYQGEPRVKYQGDGAQIATRTVFKHKPGSGLCVREQVEVKTRAGVFVAPEYDEMERSLMDVLRAINGRLLLSIVLLVAVIVAVFFTVCGG